MTMAQSDQLLIPEAAQSDAKSFDLLRVWVAHNDQHVSLRTGVWDDPAAWGLMLADLAKHIVSSYGQHVPLDRLNTLKRLKAAFDVELQSSMNATSGDK